MTSQTQIDTTNDNSIRTFNNNKRNNSISFQQYPIYTDESFNNDKFKQITNNN